MTKEGLITGKRILIVDDEPDILETLEAMLTTAKTAKVDNFEDAKRLLETEKFDIAILDIMGVNGYDLLQIAKGRNITSVMLTAHALSPAQTVKSYREGAALYVPKDKVGHIVTYLEDVLEAKQKGKSTWSRWIERFDAYYEEKFEKDWRSKDKDFWEGL